MQVCNCIILTIYHFGLPAFLPSKALHEYLLEKRLFCVCVFTLYIAEAFFHGDASFLWEELKSGVGKTLLFVCTYPLRDARHSSSSSSPNRFLDLIRVLLLPFCWIPQFTAQIWSICPFLCTVLPDSHYHSNESCSKASTAQFCPWCHAFLLSPCKRRKWRSKWGPKTFYQGYRGCVELHVIKWQIIFTEK